MLTRSIRISAVLLFALSTGSELRAGAAQASGAQTGAGAAQKTPNVKIVVIDLTVDQIVVRGARLCTDANDVEVVFLGRSSLTVISSTPGLMIFAFDRDDIVFGVSYALSIICVDGQVE